MAGDGDSRNRRARDCGIRQAKGDHFGNFQRFKIYRGTGMSLFSNELTQKRNEYQQYCVMVI
jgi:hypothetical protein